LAAGRTEQGEQSDKKRPFDNGSDRDQKKGRRNGDSLRRPCPFTEYTPLTVAPKQILAEIRDKQYVRWPPRMCSDPRRHNQDKYCPFHCDHGNDTSKCRHLKDEIESLIKRGYLGWYVRRNEDRPRRREWTPEQPINNEPNEQEINMIAGGFSAGRESNQSRCDYARRVHLLTPVELPLFGFSGVSAQPRERECLPIIVGTTPKNVTEMVDFLVIQSMPRYNAILGRGLIGRIKAVPSSLHQKMKFPTSCGIDEVLGGETEDEPYTQEDGNDLE
ncbi:hypothetical protein Taro_031459, partial [Colocasia esculenta]|nr:hypothetical protein [Colocasia esculenta]